MVKYMTENDIFIPSPDGNAGSILLTESGIATVKILMGEYTDKVVRQESGISRTSLQHYVDRKRISKKGQEAIRKLIRKFNAEEANKNSESLSVSFDLGTLSEYALLSELKRRGCMCFISA